MVDLLGRRRSLTETEEGNTKTREDGKWSLEPVRLWQSVLQKGESSPGKEERKSRDKILNKFTFYLEIVS